jgi:Fur family ferric uptake transcriptional regulator
MTRRTVQRQAIRDAFERADRPLSPSEVLGSAQRRVPSLGLATIYRNLKALVGEGWLAEVALPGEPSRYEIAGKHHHHHFRCRICDRVFEVDSCPPDLTRLTPRGFRLESHDITLHGRCADCARG